MKQFQELRIPITIAANEMIENIEAHIPENWLRDKDAEVDLFESSHANLYCFKFESENKNKCKLWLAKKNNDLRVTNIIPMDKSELTINEYNEIIVDFAQNCLKRNRIDYVLSKSDLTLKDLLCEESLQYFSAFSHTANKSTGHSHPSDEELWFHFLYSMAKNGDYLGTQELRFFLCEDGWNEQTAFNLSLDMEYGYNAMKFALDGAK